MEGYSYYLDHAALRWSVPDSCASFVDTYAEADGLSHHLQNQLKAYADFIPEDDELSQLFRKAIALQARYFTEFPFCNSFQPPRESGIAPEVVEDSDCQYVEPACTNKTVFTCNYEADSFGAFQALSTLYHEKTGDTSFITTTWTKALEKQVEIMEAEQPPTLDDRGYVDSALNFTRDGNVVDNDGVGPPQLSTGMVGTAFRPSDDRVTYRFHIPDNAMLAVTLQNLAPLLSNHSSELASRARHLSQQIRNGIEQFGVVEHPRWGKVYAYEVDGYGSHNLMDDANVPSLLALPYLGYCGADSSTYQNTRAMVLSPLGNPYYNVGQDGGAIGSPHTWIQHVWPMSLVSQIYTSDDDEEIARALGTLTNTTSGLGLMHESFYVHDSSQFTRQWFACKASPPSTVTIDLLRLCTTTSVALGDR